MDEGLAELFSLTGPFAILTGALPVRNMHFAKCLRGSLPVLPVQPPKGGSPAVHSSSPTRQSFGAAAVLD